jgi:hypothetical protein
MLSKAQATPAVLEVGRGGLDMRHDCQKLLGARKLAGYEMD